MRKSLITSAAAAGALAFVLVAPGQAGAVDTPLTFGVSGGDLTITAPIDTQTLTVSGQNASGNISPVVVNDARRSISNWVASAISTAFEKSDDAAVKIPASAVSYLPGLAAVTGVATVTPGSVLLPITIDTSKAVQYATLVVGSNTATWSGAVNVALPSNIQAGTYNGRVTHSVA